MAEALWRAAPAAAAMGGRLDGSWAEDAAVASLGIDSRALSSGALFVALQGARDGHDFIAAALAAGAVGALASRRPAGLAADAPLILVEGDTLAALERLAVAARARAADLFAVGVTGSAGKTTVKEMLRAVGLAALGDPRLVHAADKSFNNHIGVPLTLASTPATARFGAYEIGMNHPGEIAPLARLARPDAAIVTTVAEAHLEAFESIEGIADEKISIIDGARAGAAAILNAEAPCLARMRARAEAAGLEILDFGAEARAARLIAATPDAEGQRVEAEILGAPERFRLTAPGRHLATNALATLLAALRAGLDRAAAIGGLEGWTPYAGRGQRITVALRSGGAITLVDESYNANPASMRAALGALAAAPAGRRVAFLTDMRELGPAAESLHVGLLDALEAAEIDALHVAGPHMRALWAAAPAAMRGEAHDDAEALAARAVDLLSPGDVAFVKGSLGSGAHKIVSRLKNAAPRPTEKPEQRR